MPECSPLRAVGPDHEAALDARSMLSLHLARKSSLLRKNLSQG